MYSTEVRLTETGEDFHQSLISTWGLLYRIHNIELYVVCHPQTSTIQFEV